MSNNVEWRVVPLQTEEYYKSKIVDISKRFTDRKEPPSKMDEETYKESLKDLNYLMKKASEKIDI